MFADEMPTPVRLVSPIVELPPQHPAMMGSLAPASVVGQRDLGGEFRGEGMSGVYMNGGALPVFERLRRGLPAKEEWYEFALMDNAKRAKEYEDAMRRQFMVEVAKQRFEEENAFRPIGRRKKGNGFSVGLLGSESYDTPTQSIPGGMSPKQKKEVWAKMMARKKAKGEGFFDSIAKAFDPNRNGVARAFQPKNIAKAFDPVAKAFDPNRNGIKKGVEKIIKDTGAEKFITKTLPSTLIHQGIPAVAEFVGSKFGVGKQARALGEKGASELGKVSGMGFKKGSPEMKAHMAKLRSMRKKKSGSGVSVGMVGNQKEYDYKKDNFKVSDEFKKELATELIDKYTKAKGKRPK
jgi:hypothetical protein